MAADEQTLRRLTLVDVPPEPDPFPSVWPVVFGAGIFAAGFVVGVAAAPTVAALLERITP